MKRLAKKIAKLSCLLAIPVLMVTAPPGCEPDSATPISIPAPV